MFPTIIINPTHNKLTVSRLHAGARDFCGNSALHRAVCKGQAELAESLIALGADVNGRDDAGTAPLHQAVMAGDIRIATILLDSGADTIASTDHGVTPIELAQMFGRLTNPTWRGLLA